MKVTEIDISKIIPYGNNPRDNSRAVSKVAESIRLYGMQQPIVVDKDHVIIIGHTRYAAMKYLGKKKIPCIVADDLDEKKVSALRLADNKTGEIAEWDKELLGVELSELLENGVDEIEDFFDDSNFAEDGVGLEVKKMCTCPKCRYSGEMALFERKK